MLGLATFHYCSLIKTWLLFLGERELVEFLAEEIIAEKKAQKKNVLPAEIDGFKVKLNRADVELEKKNEKER